MASEPHQDASRKRFLEGLSNLQDLSSLFSPKDLACSITASVTEEVCLALAPPLPPSLPHYFLPLLLTIQPLPLSSSSFSPCGSFFSSFFSSSLISPFVSYHNFSSSSSSLFSSSLFSSLASSSHPSYLFLFSLPSPLSILSFENKPLSLIRTSFPNILQPPSPYTPTSIPPSPYCPHPERSLSIN